MAARPTVSQPRIAASVLVATVTAAALGVGLIGWATWLWTNVASLRPTDATA